MKPYAFNPIMRTGFQPATACVIRPYNAQRPVAKEFDQKTTTPSANILRMENGFEIRLAVPGVPKNQIKIEVVENQLIVSATNPNQGEQPKFVRHEFDFNGFKRTFNLHKNADTAQLKASFDQGILTITIPDREPETRKIEIL
jgi:HSP20 family protein